MLRQDIGSYTDIIVVCALQMEAQAFLDALTKENSEPIKQGFSAERLEYRHTTIHNHDDEKLKVLVSWLPSYGQLAAGLHVMSLVREFQPRFAAMTGICAGDRQRVVVGDLVVAERAFSYDKGKIVTDAYGKQQHLYDTDTTSISSVLLQYLRSFQGWREAVDAIARPISTEQQRDWLLNRLLKVKRLEAISQKDLAKNAPNWRRLTRNFQQGNEPLLNAKYELINEEKVLSLPFDRVFPFQDPDRPERYIAPIGSGNAVRADNPFEEIRVPVRGTIAIDMEGAAFYQTLTNFSSIRSLIVKGVADYANEEKEDSFQQEDNFQQYAATVSALYMLSFIKEYVNERLMPRHGSDHTGKKASDLSRATQSPKSSNAITTPDPSASSATTRPEGALSLLYFYAEEDRVICEKLKKQLIMMRRLQKIWDYDINDIRAGYEVQEQVQQLLHQADIILLLVSPNLFASEKRQAQLELAWQQRERGARVIPIIIKPVASWEDTEYSKANSLPRSKGSVHAWGDIDMALYDIAREIQAVVKNWNTLDA